MTKAIFLALDKSARTIDADGRLHIAKSHISKATVNPYYGYEIPGWESLGLVKDKVYRLFRDPAEIEKAVDSFARLPVLSKHVPVTIDTLDDEQKKLIVGSIGSDVEFNAPYLDADICIWDKAAIAGIETEQVKELSCGYRYVPVMESGEYNGEAYDGRMTEIRGNHLALVSVGRAGADVVVSDSNPFTKEVMMKMSRLGKALFAAIGLASPALAADSALPGLVGNASRKDVKKLKEKLVAMDTELSPERLDDVIDALLDVEQEPDPIKPQGMAGDSNEEKIRALLAGKVDDAVIAEICGMLEPATAVDEDPKAKPACDEEKEEGMKKEEVEAAMDAMRKGLKEAAEAQREVRQTVGDVFGMDSAEEVYGFALDHLKVDRTGVEGAPALRALYRAATAKPAQAPRIAQDAAAAAVKFPGLSRFSRA